jgi:Uri superfamily endonuclease
MTDHGHTEDQCAPMFDGGLYVFLMRLTEPRSIQVGALGLFDFPEGWYLYTGSAKRNLAKRVERHWSLKQKLRWHIDHLATAPGSEPVGAIVVPDSAGISECFLNREIERGFGGQVPAPGFGASDCKAGCPAHLFFSRAPVSLLAMAQIHPEAAVLIPQAGIWEPPIHKL